MAWTRQLTVAVLLLVWAAAPTGAQRVPGSEDTGRLFLWKATSKTNAVYLLGSIHVATEDMYPLPDEILKAFAASKALAVEVDLTKVDPAAMQTVMMEKGVYPPGDTIGRHVSKDTLDKLRAYFKGRGLPAAAMEQFRPWALAVTVTMLEVQALGYKTELGIDKHFMDQAGGRRIIELESAQEQLALLGGFPEQLEAEFLASTLDNAAKTKELIGQTVAFWKAGDAEGLERLVITGPLKERPDLKGVYAKMFDERNAAMTKKIEGFLKGKEPHFVVVGAGHLIGDKGIVNLLEKRGYKVEQVKVGGNAVADAGAAKAPAAAGAPEPQQPQAKPDAGKAAAPGQKPAKKPDRGYIPADAWAK